MMRNIHLMMRNNNIHQMQMEILKKNYTCKRLKIFLYKLKNVMSVKNDLHDCTYSCHINEL